MSCFDSVNGCGCKWSAAVFGSECRRCVCMSRYLCIHLSVSSSSFLWIVTLSSSACAHSSVHAITRTYSDICYPSVRLCSSLSLGLLLSPVLRQILPPIRLCDPNKPFNSHCKRFPWTFRQTSDWQQLLLETICSKHPKCGTYVLKMWARQVYL